MTGFISIQSKQFFIGHKKVFINLYSSYAWIQNIFRGRVERGGVQEKCRKSEAQFGNFTKYVELINYTYTELSRGGSVDPSDTIYR